LHKKLDALDRKMVVIVRPFAVPVDPVVADGVSDDDEEVVYVRKGNQTERRKVRLGVSNYSYAEIVDGLQEGEEVLLVKPASLSGKS